MVVDLLELDRIEPLVVSQQDRRDVPETLAARRAEIELEVPMTVVRLIAAAVPMGK